jgi:hypothetical protein
VIQERSWFYGTMMTPRCSGEDEVVIRREQAADDAIG